MAIPETRKKMHFVPFDIKRGRSKDNSPTPTITISKGLLRFNKSLMVELALEGKFVKFFFDPLKKVIGFKMVDLLDQRDMKNWKLVRGTKMGGVWSVSIKRMLEANFGESTAKKVYPMLPVQKYIESSDIMERGQQYYFVEIVDEIE